MEFVSTIEEEAMIMSKSTKRDEEGIFLTWEDLQVNVPNGRKGRKPILEGVTVIFAARSDGLRQQSQDWLNHGGDLLNRRCAYKENKISTTTAPNLRLKWKFYAGKDITATPTIFDGVLYFPSWNGDIYAVKEADGSLVWKQNLHKLTGLNATGLVSNVNWTVSRSTPTVAEDLLITGIYGPAMVIALKRSTGELVWNTTLDNHSFAVITMSGTYHNGSVQYNCTSLGFFYNKPLILSIQILTL
ncbi:uncharacterized protein LOC113862528 [Abrus precatorius]|uniref:Uncharacterized protein LOC113862528 n=1 Tax=Abrus precatorius TaxID=3816 RepID=A0A8B8L5D9_ABRPR|nr:uncharacterized protein LOC113862528 [Abrus precatorius]